MDPLTRAFTLIFLTTTMAAIGLKVTTGELVSAFRDRSLMARSLGLNLILVPLLGLVLVKIFPMSRDAEIGILLLAAAPGGLNAIQFTSKTKDALCYAAALLFILTLLSVLLSPVIAGLLLPSGTSLALPYGRVIRFIVLYLLLPLLAGLGVHRLSGPIAEKLSKPLALCGTVFFVVVVIRMLAMRKQAMAAMSKTELAVILALIILSMVLGWVLGGPSIETRRILATSTSMRNAALCMVIAMNGFPNTDVDVTVIAFSGLMIFPNMLFTVYELVREKRHRKASEKK
jgi:BASS family bile acid:Na+ symporter